MTARERGHISPGRPGYLGSHLDKKIGVKPDLLTKKKKPALPLTAS